MARLHLGKQRDDVLGVGHVVCRAHVIADERAALAAVNDGADDVLDVGDANHAVDGAVVDGHAREAGAAHKAEHLVQVLGVLDAGHVHTRDHDLAGDSVAQVDDLVNHGLLLLGEVVGVCDHVLELLLRHVLAVIGGLDAQKRREAGGGLGGEPHERGGDFHEAADGACHRLGHGLGVGQSEPLGHELAHDSRDIGHDERDGHDGDGARDALGEAEAHKPGGQRIRETGGGEGRGREAHERDGHLNGRQELVGVGREVKGVLRAFVALLGLGLEKGPLRGGHRHLGCREEAVDQGENKRDANTNGYVHARLRDLLGSMVRCGRAQDVCARGLRLGF